MSKFSKLSLFASMSPTWIGILTGCALLAPAALVGATLYTRGHTAIKAELKIDLVSKASTGAALIDPSLHKTFVSPEQESSFEYISAIEPLKRLLESDPRIAYIYSYVVHDDQVKFVLDPTEAGDADGDGVDDKSHIMEEYEDATSEMLHAVRSGKAIAEDDLTQDDWGVFISGFAPIKDANGKVIGAVGVDLDAQGYANRMAEFRQAGYVAALVALLSACLIGIGSALFQRHLIAHRNEQSKSHQALREIADSLDKTNERLQVANKRFEQLFHMIPVPCFTIDSQKRIIEWNRGCEQLFGFQAYEVVLHDASRSIASADNAPKLSGIFDSVIAQQPTADLEWTDVNSKDKPYTVMINAIPLVSPTGTVTGGIISLADITVRKELQLKIENQMREIQGAYKELEQNRLDLEHINSALSKANSRLAHQANIDGLTELFNRVYTCGYLDCELVSTRGFDVPTSAIMVDIDHFKSLNDDFGHLIGDKVLKAVANTLLTVTRQTDIVGRYGGEEFLIVLPGTDKADGMQIAERLRQSIESEKIVDRPVTISLGVATSDSGDCSANELIALADAALYEAKRRGRNRVSHASDGLSTDAA